MGPLSSLVLRRAAILGRSVAPIRKMALNCDGISELPHSTLGMAQGGGGDGRKEGAGI